MENLKVHFNNLIAAPEWQDANDAAFLQEQAFLFPYCQSLKLALARNSSVFRLKDSAEKTSTAAIYAPDRVVLFNLIGLAVRHSEEDSEESPLDSIVLAPIGSVTQEEPETIQRSNGPEAAVEAPDTLPEISIPLTEEITVADQPELNERSAGFTSKIQARSQERLYQEDISVRKTFLYWLKKTQRGYFLNAATPGSASFKEESSAANMDPDIDPLEKNYQAASFRLEESETTSDLKDPDLKDVTMPDIKSDPDISDLTGVVRVNVQDLPMTESRAEISSATISSELGIVTETLAAIYYQQKLYSKALQAYDDLALKFPNKSAYFAGLQEKILKESKK